MFEEYIQYFKNNEKANYSDFLEYCYQNKLNNKWSEIEYKNIMHEIYTKHFNLKCTINITGEPYYS